MHTFIQITTQPTSKGTIVVNIPYIYKDVCIKKGYESNGATIPRIFWTVFPPFSPRYRTACVIHDYLCQKEKYVKADRYFDEILRKSSVGTFTRVSLVSGVRLWHKIAYQTNNKPRLWLNIVNNLKDNTCKKSC